MLKLVLLPNLLIITTLSAPIADIIRGRPDLSRTAAIIARNPAWTGTNPVTVFVATDAAIAAATGLNPDKLGSFTMSGVLDYRTSQNYRIVEDVDGVNRMVYDNYAGGQPTPEIHCRFGTGEAIARAWLQADNGWVYVIDNVIVPPLSPLATMRSSWVQSTQFADLIERSGMANVINGLTASTILTPVDGFYTRYEAQINGYTLAQTQALIWNHVIPQLMYSTALNAGPVATRNDNERVTLTLGNDAVSFNSSSVGCV